MSRTTKTNDAALAAFIQNRAEIASMLARLQGLCDNHFDTDPAEVHWGHVGTLAHYAKLLREIGDSAFCEGEHTAR